MGSGKIYAKAYMRKTAGLLSRDGEAKLQPVLVPGSYNPFVLVNHSPTICLNPPY
jgi:hypothetical protein